MRLLYSIIALSFFCITSQAFASEVLNAETWAADAFNHPSDWTSTRNGECGVDTDCSESDIYGGSCDAWIWSYGQGFASDISVAGFGFDVSTQTGSAISAQLCLTPGVVDSWNNDPGLSLLMWHYGDGPELYNEMINTDRLADDILYADMIIDTEFCFDLNSDGIDFLNESMGTGYAWFSIAENYAVDNVDPTSYLDGFGQSCYYTGPSSPPRLIIVEGDGPSGTCDMDISDGDITILHSACQHYADIEETGTCNKWILDGSDYICDDYTAAITQQCDQWDYSIEIGFLSFISAMIFNNLYYAIFLFLLLVFSLMFVAFLTRYFWRNLNSRFHTFKSRW